MTTYPPLCQCRRIESSHPWLGIRATEVRPGASEETFEVFFQQGDRAFVFGEPLSSEEAAQSLARNIAETLQPIGGE